MTPWYCGKVVKVAVCSRFKHVAQVPFSLPVTRRYAQIYWDRRRTLTLGISMDLRTSSVSSLARQPVRFWEDLGKCILLWLSTFYKNMVIVLTACSVLRAISVVTVSWAWIQKYGGVQQRQVYSVWTYSSPNTTPYWLLLQDYILLNITGLSLYALKFDKKLSWSSYNLLNFSMVF